MFDDADFLEIFKGLNPAQIKAVKHLDGPALVVAGPGSGKTRVLTHRIAYLIQKHDVSASRILCVTFTNKAAAEIKNRVAYLLGTKNAIPWSGTFHSICARILRIDGKEIEIPNTFVIYDSDDQSALVRQIEKDFGIDPKKFNPYAILAAISSAKTELVSPESYESVAQGYFQKTVAKVFFEYKKRLKQNNALDFDDILVDTIKLFQTAPQILQKYQRIFEYTLVDEYQDTNRAQYVLTKMFSEGTGNLFVVGDMSQAIYAFRGADYRNILNFQRDYPAAIVYNLEQNYRSTQNILDAATNIIKNNNTHIALDLWTENGTGEKIVCYTGGSEKEEARFVTENIVNEIANGTDYSEIAVLYRTNAQSRNIEEALIRGNIPYKIIGGLKFYARKEIRDLIAYLKVIHNPKDSISWERIINVPPRGIGQKGIEALKAQNWDLAEVDKKTGLPFSEWIGRKEEYSTLELMDSVLTQTRYIAWLKEGPDENAQRIENIEELKSVAAQFVDINEFLENVALIESSDKPSNDNFNAVTLMTVHASKGLEYKAVFIVGMEEGLFPHMQSMMEEGGIEEERRLCYVAVTRAKERLFITNTSTRLYFGSVQANMPSRFIFEIPDKLVESQGTSRKSYRMGAGRGGGSIARSNDDYMDDLDYDRLNFKWD